MKNDPIRKRKSVAAHGLVLLAGVMLFLGMVTTAAADGEELSAETKAQANNPLASLSAFNLQNFYAPSLYGVPNQSINTFYLRVAYPIRRTLTRASLPLPTRPSSLTTAQSGLGDFNIFTAYLFVSNPTTSVGLGPLLVAPTATDDLLGQGKWQLGAAALVFKAMSPVVQAGGLLTWQASVGGDEDRPDTSLLVAQPFGIWQLGGGKYLRSTAIWVFDLKSGEYAVPFGLGVGQVLKSGKIVYNLFIEPQFTFLQKGTGQPKIQIFVGLHLQFYPLIPRRG